MMLLKDFEVTESENKKLTTLYRKTHNTLVQAVSDMYDTMESIERNKIFWTSTHNYFLNINPRLANRALEYILQMIDASEAIGEALDRIAYAKYVMYDLYLESGDKIRI